MWQIIVYVMILFACSVFPPWILPLFFFQSQSGVLSDLSKGATNDQRTFQGFSANAKKLQRHFYSFGHKFSFSELSTSDNRMGAGRVIIQKSH